MFEAVGYRVKHLLRVRVGNLRLADLPRGHWRALTKRELESITKERRLGQPSIRSTAGKPSLLKL
jgi:16S rRNA U516 pseudouridylate synthase RsuA-like enzyme